MGSLSNSVCLVMTSTRRDEKQCIIVMHISPNSDTVELYTQSFLDASQHEAAQSTSVLRLAHAKLLST
jgi:hypothetical protein